MKIALSLCLLLVLQNSFAAESPAVTKLEARVQALEQSLNSVSNTLNQLMIVLGQHGFISLGPSDQTKAPALESKTLSEWARLLSGKSRKEVVALLGAPTSMHNEGYALMYHNRMFDPVLGARTSLCLGFGNYPGMVSGVQPQETLTHLGRGSFDGMKNPKEYLRAE